MDEDYVWLQQVLTFSPLLGQWDDVSEIKESEIANYLSSYFTAFGIPALIATTLRWVEL